MLKKVLVLVIAFLLFAGSLSAAERDLLEWKHPLGLAPHHPYGVLTGNYVSPHIKWAKPLYGGKLRVLVMAPTWTHRETVELAQRLSIDYTPWMCQSFTEATRTAGADQADSPFRPRPMLSIAHSTKQ